MNQYKKHIVQVTIVVLMLNSAMPVQAIDWSYWSNCAREKISGFVASMPSKNQVIDRLKQPKILGALAIVSVAAAVGLYYMQNRQSSKPKQLNLEEITKQAQMLLSNKYALNKIQSPWNIGGVDIWKISELEFKDLTEKYEAEDLLNALDNKYEYINISEDENLTPKALEENKSYIKLFCNLKGVNLEQLNAYISDLDSCIKSHAPCTNLDNVHMQLQGRLEQRFEQMKVFRNIVQEKAQQGR